MSTTTYSYNGIQYPDDASALAASQAGGGANPAANAAYNTGLDKLKNNYQQIQQGALQNTANRFGGLNASALNDQMYQNNYNMNQSMGDLSNAYVADTMKNNQMEAQTNLTNQQAQQGATTFGQQQADYNNPYNVQARNQGYQNAYKTAVNPNWNAPLANGGVNPYDPTSQGSQWSQWNQNNNNGFPRG